MDKKQHIRHLEPYGYVDQNNYINELNAECEKGCICPCEPLIEFKNRQCAINKEFCKSLSGHTELLSALDEDFNALSSKTDEIQTEADRLAEAVQDTVSSLTEVEEGLSGLTDDVLTIANDLAEHAEAIIEMQNDLEDTYTKEECDSLFASKEEASGYTEGLAELSGKVDTLQEEVEQKFDEIDLSAFTLSQAIDDETLRAKGQEDVLDEKITVEVIRATSAETALNDAIDSEIERATSEEERLESKFDEEIANLDSALTSEIASEAERAQAAESALDEKIDGVEASLVGQLQEVSDNLADLNANKASKEELSDEVARATSAETSLGDRIDSISEGFSSITSDIETLSGKAEQAEIDIAALNDRVDAVEVKEEEIEDEIDDAVADLIGNSGDTTDMDTIWASKNYAKSLSGSLYTNLSQLISDSATTIITNAEHYTDEQVSSKVNESDFENFANDIENEIATQVETINNAISGMNANIQSQLAQMSAAIWDKLNELDETLTRLSTIVGALTTWNGEGTYDGSGNGVVDRMYQEFPWNNNGGN